MAQQRTEDELLAALTVEPEDVATVEAAVAGAIDTRMLPVGVDQRGKPIFRSVTALAGEVRDARDRAHELEALAASAGKCL